SSLIVSIGKLRARTARDAEENRPNSNLSSYIFKTEMQNDTTRGRTFCVAPKIATIRLRVQRSSGQTRLIPFSLCGWRMRGGQHGLIHTARRTDDRGAVMGNGLPGRNAVPGRQA